MYYVYFTLLTIITMKETQSTDPNQWPGVILSSSTGLMMEEALLHLYWILRRRYQKNKL